MIRLAVVLTVIGITGLMGCGQEEQEPERVYITRISPSPVPGPAGDRGPTGEMGPTGAAGRDGEPGADGAVGPAGEQGVAGADGADGVDGQDGINGADGVDGLPGPTGPAGSNGSNGSNGITYTFVIQVNSPCTLIEGTTRWINNNTVYTSAVCDNTVKLGTLGEGVEFWLTTTISLIRINPSVYRKTQN